MKPDWTGVHLESVHERYVTSVRPILKGALVAASLVLAIACANVGVLVLLRAMRRQPEMGVRIALGAGHRHILRLLLAETSLLSGVAIVLVVALTSVVLRTLSPVIEAQLGRPAPAGPSSIGMSSTVFAAVACVGIAVALALSFVPLVTPWQRLLAGALRQSGRSASDGRTMQRLRTMLIATELAGSLVLLTACGMLLRTVVNMAGADLGFRAKNLVRASVVVPERSYPDAASRLALYQRITDRAAAVTHARVALTTWPPYAENPARAFVTDGGVTDARGAATAGVGVDYFDALGISLVEGRAFTAADRVGTEPVMIVSETVARRLWPNSSAIGHRIQTAPNVFGSPDATTWRTIVGVVRDVRQSYTDAELNDIYLPFFQLAPDRYGSFYLESSLPAVAVEQSLRVSLAETDPDSRRTRGSIGRRRGPSARTLTLARARTCGHRDARGCLRDDRTFRGDCVRGPAARARVRDSRRTGRNAACDRVGVDARGHGRSGVWTRRWSRSVRDGGTRTSQSALWCSALRRSDDWRSGAGAWRRGVARDLAALATRGTCRSAIDPH
jgi:hypothetical protein